MRWLFDLFGVKSEPVLAPATVADAASFARLHAASFRRGWSEAEFEALLAERGVLAHRARLRGRTAGFILSRLAADEAEILSVAVARRNRGKGVARQLLMLHLRRLAALGIRVVYLEVDEENVAARRLYWRAGFTEAGRRPAYYQQAGAPTAAIVLRRTIN